MLKYEPAGQGVKLHVVVRDGLQAHGFQSHVDQHDLNITILLSEELLGARAPERRTEHR